MTITTSWKHLCPASRLSDSDPLGFKIGEIRIGLFKVDGEIFAIDDVCPHAFALLSTGFIDGHVVECPLHGAMFDLRNGECRSGEYDDTRVFPVEVRDGEIYVNLEGR
jgi:nitrite reductase/ring-hydroxylating ferredoxin subunit